MDLEFEKRLRLNLHRSGIHQASCLNGDLVSIVRMTLEGHVMPKGQEPAGLRVGESLKRKVV